MAIKIGAHLPDIKLDSTTDHQINLADLKGKRVILYFYPKDDTPGCTVEAQDFRDHIKDFAKLNTVVFGVSRDSIKSHEKFANKYCLPFSLLSDEDEALCQLFEVIKNKNMYGKQVRGIERSTFLFNEHGKLVQEWRKVKVEGHAAALLVAIKQLHSL